MSNDKLAQALREKIDSTRKANTYRGRINSAAAFAIGLMEDVLAAHASEQAQAAEPVAWCYQDARGHYRYVGHKPHRANFAAEYAILNPVPLYTSPQALTPEQEREAFEAWAIKTQCSEFDLERGRLTGYRMPELNRMWVGWQARAALSGGTK